MKAIIKMSSETKAANPGKKKEGFLRRQAKQSKAANEVTVTEDELLQKDFVTPEDVLRLNKGTDSKYILELLFFTLLSLQLHSCAFKKFQGSIAIVWITNRELAFGILFAFVVF